ncbi:unnamed protein product [Callosobruchus maculatus]|uniref:Uncharacterized protein n=1 Tax=Callosobruchus maculatus TaxID=64391 RepID=A0A653DWC0_CALMS|nr:unnamed protein product [Callosobruchus maculatus]
MLLGNTARFGKNARRQTRGDLLPDDSCPSHDAHHNPVVSASHGFRSGGLSGGRIGCLLAIRWVTYSGGAWWQKPEHMRTYGT